MLEKDSNYYLILELDPDCTDWNTVENAISQKKTEWSKKANAGVSSARMEAKRFLDMIGDMTLVLRDPQARKVIAAEAKITIANQHVAAINELEPIIAMILAGGGKLTKKQLKTIYLEVRKRLSLDEIEDLFQKAGVKIEGDIIPKHWRLPECRVVLPLAGVKIEGDIIPKPYFHEPLLDKSLMKEIRKDLDFLRIRDLYSFLGMSESDSIKLLIDESLCLFNRLVVVISTSEIDAKRSLIGHCLKIFSSEDNRIRYDNSRAVEPLYELESLIRIAGQDSFINRESMQILIDQALKRGVKPEITIDYLREYAEKKGWKLLYPDDADNERSSTDNKATSHSPALLLTDIEEIVLPRSIASKSLGIILDENSGKIYRILNSGSILPFGSKLKLIINCDEIRELSFIVVESKSPWESDEVQANDCVVIGKLIITLEYPLIKGDCINLELILDEKGILKSAIKGSDRFPDVSEKTELQIGSVLIEEESETAKRRKIYGIDLGTTYSCIAVVGDHGKPEVIANSEGELTTPSVVYFESESNIVVGKAAKEYAIIYPDKVASTPKRFMGDANYIFRVYDQNFTAQELSSYILRKLVEDAQRTTGEEIKDVVITCPAYFGLNQKEATKQAGEIAGLNVLYVIPEPTAAAIAYGIDQEEDQTVLVYSLSGGTFDITFIEIKGGNVKVIATGGDDGLGGINWDEAIVNYLANSFAEAMLDDPDTYQELLNRAEEIKKALSTKNEHIESVRFEADKAKIKITREKFDELTSSLIERTISYTREMIDRVKKKGYNKIDLILLVGGSIYMPQVQERLSELHIRMVRTDPDQIVVKGAAIFGQMCIEANIQETLKEICVS